MFIIRAEKMNIIKPKNVYINKLKKIENIEERIKSENEIENVIIENYKRDNINFACITLRKSIINNVEIINSKLEKYTFTDIYFNNCNFSNTIFENCSFIRCEFNNCKLTGCNFIECGLTDINFIDDNMNYINLSTTNLKNISFKKTLLRNSIFQENKIKNIIFEKADLKQAQFFETKLNGIDFSDSIIEEMAVSLKDIKGAIINQFQAIDLIYLLEVKIKI